MAETTNEESTWASLNEELKGASEEQCWKMLEAEKTGQRRVQFLLRIFGRAHKLRGIRERSALLAGL